MTTLSTSSIFLLVLLLLPLHAQRQLKFPWQTWLFLGWYGFTQFQRGTFEKTRTESVPNMTTILMTLHIFTSTQDTTAHRIIQHTGSSCTQDRPDRMVLHTGSSYTQDCLTQRINMHRGLSCKKVCPANRIVLQIWLSANRIVLHIGLYCAQECHAHMIILHTWSSCTHDHPAHKIILHTWSSFAHELPAQKIFMHTWSCCTQDLHACRIVLYTGSFAQRIDLQPYPQDNPVHNIILNIEFSCTQDCPSGLSWRQMAQTNL